MSKLTKKETEVQHKELIILQKNEKLEKLTMEKRDKN